MVDHKEQVKEILCSKLFLINNNKMFLLYEFFESVSSNSIYNKNKNEKSQLRDDNLN